MKSVNRITTLNIASTFLLQGIMFFTTPIFTRMLGTSQYGMYSVFNSWVAILTCIMGFSMHSSLGTGLYQFKNAYFKFRNSVLLFSTIICIAEISLVVLMRNILSEILGYDSGIIILLGVTAFSHYIVNFVQNSCVYEKKAVTNFILSVSLSVLTVGLSILLISKSSESMKYIGRIYGVAIPYCLIAIIMLIVLFSKCHVGLYKQYCSFGITVGFPIVFHSLAQNILSQSDRVMMQFMSVSSSEIGIYSLFYSLSAVLSTVLNALNTSWCPFYYDDVDARNWDALNGKCKNYIELFSVLAVGFLLLSREVSYVMADDSYWSGINIIPILVFAVFFTFMYQFPVNFEFFLKKTKIIAIGTVCSGLLNIFLNAIMIPLWGMYGAAGATALSYGALFVMHYYIVRNMKEHPYHLRAIVFIPGLVAVIIGTILFYALSPWWYLRWGIGIIIGLFEAYRIWKRKSIF